MAGMFDVTKPGKGVSKDQVAGKKGFGLFMDIFFRRFWKLIVLNIVYIIVSLPAIYISFELVRFASILFMEYTGVSHENVRAMSTAIQLTPFFMLLLIQFCGTGPATAGLNYVLKKFVDDTHAWVWSDFMKSFKQNWKQGLCVYLINTAFVVLCVISMMIYGFVLTEMRMFSLVIAVALIIFLMMQLYVYQLMAGFKLTLKQLYKNSFILLILKFPSNVGIMLVSLFIIYVMYNLIAGVAPAVFIITFIMVMVVFFSIITMAQIFMSRKTIQKYMIDHFENEEDEESDSENADDKDDEFE